MTGLLQLTELVPWAAHGSPFRYHFEETVALLAQKTDKTTVCELMRVAWEQVATVVERVITRVGPKDLLEGADADRDRRDLVAVGDRGH